MNLGGRTNQTLCVILSLFFILVLAGLACQSTPNNQPVIAITAVTQVVEQTAVTQVVEYNPTILVTVNPPPTEIPDPFLSVGYYPFPLDNYSVELKDSESNVVGSLQCGKLGGQTVDIKVTVDTNIWNLPDNESSEFWLNVDQYSPDNPLATFVYLKGPAEEPGGSSDEFVGVIVYRDRGDGNWELIYIEPKDITDELRKHLIENDSETRG